MDLIPWCSTTRTSSWKELSFPCHSCFPRAGLGDETVYDKDCLLVWMDTQVSLPLIDICIVCILGWWQPTLSNSSDDTYSSFCWRNSSKLKRVVPRDDPFTVFTSKIWSLQNPVIMVPNYIKIKIIFLLPSLFKSHLADHLGTPKSRCPRKQLWLFIALHPVRYFRFETHDCKLLFIVVFAE